MADPIVEVDLVLVQKYQDGDQFACMVACPTCGTVNEHGLGKGTIGQWGHRVCEGFGKFSRVCSGYELGPAALVHQVGPREWKKRTRVMLKTRREDWTKKNRKRSMR